MEQLLSVKAKKRKPTTMTFVMQLSQLCFKLGGINPDLNMQVTFTVSPTAKVL